MPERDVRSTWVPSAEWLRPPRDDDDRGPLAGPLVLLTLLAAALRLYHLGHQSFWIDEALTWQGIRPGAGLSFWEQVADSIQGPLYPLTIWPLAQAGAREFLLRLPAALAGVATVPLAAILADRLYGRRVAILAALLLTISPFHVWYSQEARGYAFVMLGAVLSGLAWLAMADRGPRPGRAALYGLAAAIAIWSNMSAVFLIAAQALCVPLLARPRSRDGWAWWGLAYLIALAAATPWLLKAGGIWAVDRLLPVADTGEALRGETTFTPWAVPYAGFAAFYGFSLGPTLRQLHAPDRLAVLREHWPVLAAGAAAAAAALAAGLTTLRGRRLALPVWIAVPVAAVVLLALRNIKPVNVRYLAVAVPWLLILAAAGLFALPRRLGRSVAVLLLGLTVWSLGNHFMAGRYAKADLRSAVAWIESHTDEGQDAVLVQANAPVFRFYAQGAAAMLPTGRILAAPTAAAADSALAEALGGRDRCWVLEARGWNWDARSRLATALRSAGSLRTVRTFEGCRVALWSRGAAADGGEDDGS